MNAIRRHLQPATWLAIVALLALALLPTLSHALVHRQSDRGALAEICTPQGMQQRVVSGADVPGGEVDRAGFPGHLEHCPYCALGSVTAVLPSPTAPALALLALTQAEPALFLRAPRTLFAWAAAQPRGPPSRP